MVFKKIKKSILIVGEGPTEKAFLQYLKELYVTRNDDFFIKIECGAGGSPDCIINKAKRLCGSRAYDECFVLIDNDRKIYKHNKKIKILLSTPCIEGLFLVILEHPKFSQVNALSDFCKKEFERNYLSYDKKMDKYYYSEIFPREVLEERRKNIPELEGDLKGDEGVMIWVI